MVALKVRAFVGFTFLSICLSEVVSARVLLLSAGRNVDYTFQEVSKDAQTLVFLPGVNRSVPTEYPSLIELKNTGYNILTLATSSHWESLRHLKASETPFYVQKSDLNTADFIEEATAVIEKLKIKNPVLVGLSYSSSMQVYSKLPQVFVAPLVKASDTNPLGAAQAAKWESGLALNPVFGQTLIRQYRDMNYRQFWSQRVTQELSRDPKVYSGVTNTQVINGYVSISRAAEDFDLTKIDLGISSFENPHIFILGEREQQNRLKGQVQTILQAMKRKQPVQVIFVKGAEHNVPLSEPMGFVHALEASMKTSNSTVIELGVANSKNKKIKWLDVDEIKKLFVTILNYDDYSTKPADIELWSK